MPTYTNPMAKRRIAQDDAGSLPPDVAHNYKRRLGLIIRDARLAKGLTQQQLADMLAVHHTMVSRVENGVNALPADWYEEITEILGLDRDRFARDILRFTNPWLYALTYGRREQALKEDLAVLQDRVSARRERNEPPSAHTRASRER